MGDNASLAVVPVTGPPGAGKSTALLALARQHPELARFGVRDYGLHLAAIGDPLGLEVRDPLLRQELLTNAQVRRAFLHFLDATPPGTRTVAVEGYPRDTAQCADLLDVVWSWGADVAAFVVVEIPDDQVRARVAGRRLCVQCGVPAAGAGDTRCAGCGGPFSRRRDDDADRLERRLADYREVSRGPRSYFADRGLLHVVDGLASAEEVRRRLAGVLRVGQETALAHHR